MKDIEWLKKEIEEYLEYEGVRDARIALESVLGYIDQLDEPETLSQEWIDENKVARINDVRKMTTSDVVPVEKLKNILVPKQYDGFVVFEKDKLDAEVQRMIDENYKEMNEKPVIPQFVADWIEEERAKIIDWHTDIPERFFLILGHKLNYTTLSNTNVSDWIFSGNEEKLYQALKYDYEVEKEKRYHVVNKENYFMLRKYDGLVDIMRVSSSMSRDEYGKDTSFMLTEKEIKDYDERFWAFAEEVTE